MDCNKIQELISLYLDNELSSQEVMELEKHFDVCNKCKQDYIALKNIKVVLSFNRKEVGLDFTSSLMCKIKKEKFSNNIISFGSMKKKIIIAAGFLFVFASSVIFIDTNKISINKQTFQTYEHAIEYYESYDEDIDDYAEYEEYMLSMLY